MNAISHKICMLATLAVLLGRAWADETAHGPQALGMATETQVGTTNNADNLAFTPVVQRALPVGPDYRGAINFATGTTPWWPQASWITRRGATRSNAK